MDYQEREFWFLPSHDSWYVQAEVGGLSNCQRSVPQCNPICECKVDFESSSNSRFKTTYWTEAYYYYEHPNTEPPTLYPSVFVPNYDASPYGDIGTNYAPINVLNSLCRNETETLIADSNQLFGASICTKYELIGDPCSGPGYSTSSSVKCQTKITKVQLI